MMMASSASPRLATCEMKIAFITGFSLTYAISIYAQLLHQEQSLFGKNQQQRAFKTCFASTAARRTIEFLNILCRHHTSSSYIAARK
jgi:hypothetical protein